jgi:xylulokinase
MAARDAGAVGAMVMAGAGVGVAPDLAAAADMVPEERRFEPDVAGARLAEARFGLWKELYAGVRPVNAGFAALVNPVATDSA